MNCEKMQMCKTQRPQKERIDDSERDNQENQLKKYLRNELKRRKQKGKVRKKGQQKKIRKQWNNSLKKGRN